MKKDLLIMFCTNCGKENQDSNKFCFNCGLSLMEVISFKASCTREPMSTDSELPLLTTQVEELPTCKGRYYNGQIQSSGGISTLNEIKITSFWKNKAIQDKSPIIFEYNPEKKEASNVRIIPIATGIGESSQIEVKGGSFKVGRYHIVGNGSALKNEHGDLIGLYNAQVSIISTERAQKKLKSVAIGAVGTLATLGVGAVLGAMHASKKYNTIEVETESGEFFIAQCRPKAYQNLYSAVKSNQNNCISNIELLESYYIPSESKNIESFFTSAKKKEGIVNLIYCVFWGVFILVVLSKCND